MEWVASIAAAIVGALLTWGTRTLRERRLRRLEAENEVLKKREEAK